MSKMRFNKWTVISIICSFLLLAYMLSWMFALMPSKKGINMRWYLSTLGKLQEKDKELGSIYIGQLAESYKDLVTEKGYVGAVWELRRRYKDRVDQSAFIEIDLEREKSLSELRGSQFESITSTLFAWLAISLFVNLAIILVVRRHRGRP